MAADLINNLLIDEENQERFCPHCRVWKPFDQFSQNHLNKVSGEQAWCQTCAPPQTKPLDTTSTKLCSHCKLSKSYDEFYRDKGQRDGRDTRCKTCRQTARFIKVKGVAPPPIKSKERINWETGEKFCNGCKTWKPLATDFQRSKDSASGRDSQCKNCTNTKARAARDLWPGRRHHKRLTFLRREELSEIRRAHGPNCDICNQPPKVQLVAVGSADEGLRGFMCEKCYKRYMNIYGPKPYHKGLVASDIAPFMHFKLRTERKKEP